MAVSFVTLYPPGGNSTQVQVVEGSQLHLIYATMGFSAIPSVPGPPVRPDPFPQYVHDDEVGALLGAAQDSAVAALVDDGNSATSGALRAAFGTPAVAAFGLASRAVRRRPMDRVLGYFGKTGHGWTGGAGAGGTFNLNDTTQPMLGAQSASYVLAANGTAVLEKTTFAAFSVVDKVIRLHWRYSGDVNQVRVYLSSGADLTNRVDKSFFLSAASPQNTDLVTDIPVAEFITAGTPNLAAIVNVRIYGTAGPGGGTLNIGAIGTTKDAAATLPNGAVVISADDSNADHWNYLRPKLAEYGFPATLYLNVGALGQTGCFTADQARYMQDVHGFELGAHAIDTAHHVSHVGQTEAWLRDHFEALVSAHRSNGLRFETFAWPNTSNDVLARRIAAEYFRGARGGVTGSAETHPAVEPMDLRAANAGLFTLAQLKVMVDKAKAGHSVAHFFFHALPTAKVGSNDVARQDFYDLVDYIAAQGVPVITAGQALNLPVV